MKKKPIDKLITRINHVLNNDSGFKREKNKIKFGNRLFFEFNENIIKYYEWRYYPERKESVVNVSFKVTIYLDGKNFEILGTNIINPPNYAKSIVDVFRRLSGNEISHLVIGAKNNSLTGGTIKITKDTYDLINGILVEESKDKNVRIGNRVIPIIENVFNVHIDTIKPNRNYSLLLKEIIESGKYTQEDVLEFADKVQIGFGNKVVIEKQIKRQTHWLIDTLQLIVDEPELTTLKAKELGYKYFNYSKVSISGPEQLMEKIFTDYGKNTFFGSPVLINTDKYVMSSKVSSRSQFDILLVNQLNDLEVIELKRPDKPILSYDLNRNKFYASKDLSIAISQSERYLSAVIRDNDDQYLICGKKIREYLNEEIGGTTQIEIIRPSAIIVMGRHQTITEPYESLDAQTQSKIKKDDYDENGLFAYKELKNAFKNIQVMTYSELIENARLRLT